MNSYSVAMTQEELELLVGEKRFKKDYRHEEAPCIVFREDVGGGIGGDYSYYEFLSYTKERVEALEMVGAWNFGRNLLKLKETKEKK